MSLATPNVFQPPTPIIQARIARAPTYITSHTPPCMNGAGTSIITGHDVLVQGIPIYIVLECTDRITHILVSPLLSCTKGMHVHASHMRIRLCMTYLISPMQVCTSGMLCSSPDSCSSQSYRSLRLLYRLNKHGCLRLDKRSIIKWYRNSFDPLKKFLTVSHNRMSVLWATYHTRHRTFQGKKRLLKTLNHSYTWNHKCTRTEFLFLVVRSPFSPLCNFGGKEGGWLERSLRRNQPVEICKQVI